MHDPEELVTIYKAANAAQAYIIRNALEAEGIACQVAEANEPLAGLNIVEPDVMVKARDRAAAEQIIADWEAHFGEESEEGAPGEEGEEELYDEGLEEAD